MPIDPCADEQATVDAINTQIEFLQEALENAPPQDKARIVARIDAEQAKRVTAQARLAACHRANDPPPVPDLTLAWPARVTGWLRGAFHGRAQAQVVSTLSFFNNRTEFRLDPLRVTVVVSKVTVTMNVSTPSSGDVLLREPPDLFRDMVIGVQVSGSALGVTIPSADLSLDTTASFDVPGEPASVGGSAMNGHGFLGMAGVTDLSALGFNARFFMLIEGTLGPPLPWSV